MSPVTTKFWGQFPTVLMQATERLKQAQIENKDAIELIESYNKEEVFIYADPPYLLSTRKNYLYEHEMKDEEHIRLLNVLKKHKGKVMISGYENDLYNETLIGWYKCTKNTTAESAIKRTEVVWMNYAPFEQLKMEI